MEYTSPNLTTISLEVKGTERQNSADGPSKCSNSCCYYRDGATWQKVLYFIETTYKKGD